MAGFGGEIKLTGATEYQRALQKCSQNLKELSSEMKLVTSTYDQNDKSVEANRARYETLTKKLDEQQNKLSLLKNKYSEMTAVFNTNEAAHKKLIDEYDKEKKQLDSLEKTLGTTSKEYQDQKEKVDSLEKEVEKSTKAYDQNEKALSNMRVEINKAQTECNKTAKEIDQLGKETEQTAEETNKASEGFTVMKGALANLVAQGISRAITAMKELAKTVVSTGVAFDSTMSEVEAISGATATEMEQLTAKAKEMGETTKFSASEAGEAFKYMAMAGWETEDMLNGIEGIMRLAAASGEDLATTSDIVTDALTAMGYSAGDAGKLADVMAAASSNANTNVYLMGETFKYAAPLIGAMGYNMEDAAVAIGMMANAGIKGTQAGTSLRSILSRMASPTSDVETAMKQLGITLTDEEGNMKSLDEVIRDLRTSFADLSETEKAQKASMIAGKNALSGMLAIVNGADEDFERLTAAVNNSTGSAERMSDVMLNNVGGKVTLLKSQLEGVYLTIYNKVEPVISRALTKMSNALRDVDWGNFATKAGNALNEVLKAFEWILKNGSTISAVIQGIVAAFAVTKLANFVSLFTALNPAVVAVTAAVAGLVVVINALTKDTTEAEKAQEEWNAKLDEQRATIEDNVTAWDDLTKARQEALDQGMTELDHYEELYDELTDLVDANGKVKEGYEGRARFITTTLSDALGIEIEMIDGVIQDYGKLQDTIDDVMEKKRAQLILDSQANMYQEAITKQQDELLRLKGIQEQYTERVKDRARAEQELADLQAQHREAAAQNNEEEMEEISRLILKKAEEVVQIKQNTTDLEEQYNAQKELVSEYAYNIAVYENNMALAHEGKYDEMSTVTWNYVKDLEQAGDAQKKALEDQIAATELNLDLMKQDYEKTGDEVYKIQIKNGEKRLKKLKEQLADYESTTEKGLDETEVVWSDSLDDQLTELTGRKIEFKNSGKDLVQMYIDGVATGEPKSKAEMKKVVDVALDEVIKAQPEADKAGQYFIEGVQSGISNQRKQSGVFSAIATFGNNILNKLKNSLKEQSPSKATAQMGQYLLEGLGIGIEDEEDNVLKQVSDFGKATLGAFETSIGGGFAIDTGKVGTVNVSSRRAVQEAEQADMVAAFKTALSQMKIVLDDEVAGQFVENTVTRIIYA